jgi:Type IV conjugative transfer system lipoprotein (TraV)
MIKNIFLCALLLVVLSGCANSHYRCGVSYGVGCKPVSDIYNELEDGSLETLHRDPYLKPGESGQIKSGASPVVVGNSFTATDKQPVFVPPREYRIWISSWTDNDVVHHGDQFIYIYVGDGRWEASQQ